MSEMKARNVGPAGIDVVYERLGDPAAPPVLLIMGGGGQLIHWPDGFCRSLVSHGLHVIRFDNRDAGLSTHFHDAPVPDLPAVLAGDLSSVSYTLTDMAADTAGLLDALGLDSVHLVGTSMGGMIAQAVAIEHPGRVRSLTSMMSTTGDRNVGQPRPEALAELTGPPAVTREDAIERTVKAFRVLGSPGYPADEEEVRERAGRAYDRSHDELAFLRQAVGVVASGDRTPWLRSLSVPTLVIHGADDLMCDVSGGGATAAAVPGAQLVVFDGMGHDLPAALWPEMTGWVAGLVRRAEAIA
ncbi:alpha/beta hydrolase [Nonomuraea sp. NPDC050691]|uniref:alpha/beta fold hydrolase n=1 Tax=Nonomuraea sp. NPDC050691 TaxID=3155661 RepID=UPI0033D51D2C